MAMTNEAHLEGRSISEELDKKISDNKQGKILAGIGVIGLIGEMTPEDLGIDIVAFRNGAIF